LSAPFPVDDRKLPTAPALLRIDPSSVMFSLYREN
jgi:hypothetical protein